MQNCVNDNKNASEKRMRVSTEFSPEIDALIGDIYAATDLTDGERTALAHRRILDLSRELSALSSSDPLPLTEASDTFATNRGRVLRHLRALLRHVYYYASHLPEDPHYETVRVPALPTENCPHPKPTVTLRYDTEINRYAMLLIVRIARAIELLCPEEHLTDSIRELLDTPFYQSLSANLTPFYCPFGFYYSRNHIGLLKAENYLSDLIFASADQSYEFAKRRRRSEEAKKRDGRRLSPDVLVGALRSPEQLSVNLAKNFYYLPASLYDMNTSPVRYVAIYQSEAMFGEEAGIRYYGEIRSVSTVPRKRIPVPYRHGHGEEPYYVFRISEWKSLPRPILPKIEGPRALRFTNLYLLTHAEYSYELFKIQTKEALALQTGLKELLRSPDSAISILDGTLTLRAESNGRLRIRYPDGEFAPISSYTLPWIQRHPLRALEELTEQLLL